MFGKIVLGIDGDRFEHGADEAEEAGAASRPTPSSTPKHLRELVDDFKADRTDADRRGLPRRPAWSSSGRDRGGLPLLERPTARHRLPAARRRSPTTSAPRSTCRRWSSATWATTPARASPSPATRSPARRSSTATTCQRPGRGRGGRHPGHRADHRALKQPTARVYKQFDGYAEQAGEALQATCRTSSSRSSAASSTCSRPAPPSAPAPPPSSIAVDMVERGPDHEEGGGRARRAAPARAAAASRASTRTPRTKPIGKGVPASPGAATGPGGLRRRQRRGVGQGGQGGDPGARRDQPRRRARHDRGQGHPHRARRHRQPRRPGRARHGQALRRRRRARSRSTCATRQFTRRRHDDQARATRSPIDGTTGEVYVGQASRPIEPKLARASDFERRSWAGPTSSAGSGLGQRRLPARRRARRASSAPQGIGLCRTEHMFMEQERLPIVQAMILADDDRGPRGAARPAAADPARRLRGHPQAMEGLPVVIRLIDPPLHEFLPNHEELIRETTRAARSPGKNKPAS